MSPRRWRVHLPATQRQWSTAVVLILLAWGLLTGYAFANQGGPMTPDKIWFFREGTAGFLLGIVAVGYVIFLRGQAAALELGPEEVTLLGRAAPRARAELLRWRHLWHEGAVLSLRGPTGSLRIGVSHRLPPPALQPIWSSESQVDAVLTAPDFSDLVEELGLAHLHWDPPPPRWRDKPIAPWLMTMAFLCGLGALLALGGVGYALMATVGGQILVWTICFGAVAVGIALTFGRTPRGRTEVGTREAGPPRPPLARPTQPERPPHFGRAAATLLAWQIYGVLGAGMLAGPALLVTYAFERWVDIPGCRAICTAHGLPFTSLTSSKSGTFCRCAGTVFHDRTFLFGGHSFLAGLADWLVRSIAVVGGTIAWLALVFLVARAFLRRRKARYRNR